MCNYDYYIFDEDDEFVKENKDFLNKSMLILYFMAIIYLSFVYLYIFVL